MNIEKNSARAKEIAEQLGVQFAPPSFEESAAKAQKRMKQMSDYRARKADYDDFIQRLMDNYDPDVIRAFIECASNPK